MVTRYRYQWNLHLCPPPPTTSLHIVCKTYGHGPTNLNDQGEQKEENALQSHVEKDVPDSRPFGVKHAINIADIFILITGSKREQLHVCHTAHQSTRAEIDDLGTLYSCIA